MKMIVIGDCVINPAQVVYAQRQGDVVVLHLTAVRAVLVGGGFGNGGTLPAENVQLPFVGDEAKQVWEKLTALAGS